MVDITHKNNTLREAIATATVMVSSQETIDRINAGTVPKGNIFEMGKAAGLLGIKKTPDLLPDCHPLPIEFASVSYEMAGLEIRVAVHVKTIYKTGVEVEAMHGASIVALTLYDMLKPIDTAVEIHSIKLLKKTGGKSGQPNSVSELRAQVVVCSDSITAGKAIDSAGRKLTEKLETYGIESELSLIPDEVSEVRTIVENQQSDILIFVGGTGLGPRDITSITVRDLLDTELEGVSEQIRRYGQERTPFAMLGRPLAGLRKGKLILALPGSEKGATESVEAIFPAILHLFDVLKGTRHAG